jgi:hypothetical protein
MVEFTAAAAKVRHRVGEAAADAPVGKGFGVVAARRTLQTMKKHQQGPALGFRSDLWLLVADRRSLRTRRVEEVHVDEVAIRRVPAFTLVLGGGLLSRAAHTGPARWSEGCHQAATRALCIS